MFAKGAKPSSAAAAEPGRVGFSADARIRNGELTNFADDHETIDHNSSSPGSRTILFHRPPTLNLVLAGIPAEPKTGPVDVPNLQLSMPVMNRLCNHYKADWRVLPTLKAKGWFGGGKQDGHECCFEFPPVESSGLVKRSPEETTE